VIRLRHREKLLVIHPLASTDLGGDYHGAPVGNEQTSANDDCVLKRLHRDRPTPIRLRINLESGFPARKKKFIFPAFEKLTG